MYLWMEKMVTTTCRKTWTMIAENKTEVNIWEQKSKECRGRRALALSRGVHIDSVSVADVQQSEGGVDHWASVMVSLDATGSGHPKAKPKAKAKARSDGSAPTGSKTVATLEKNLKSLVAQEMLIKKNTDQLRHQASEEKESWVWAQHLLKECAEHEAKVNVIKGNGFISKFVGAALSPETLKKLKKETGDEYYDEVLRSIDAIKSPLDDWSKAAGRIQAMADAANVSIDVAEGSKKQKKRKKQ